MFYVLGFELAIYVYLFFVSLVWTPCKRHMALSKEKMEIHQAFSPASGCQGDYVHSQWTPPPVKNSATVRPFPREFYFPLLKTQYILVSNKVLI